jgi:hypothetical protein
MFHSDPVAKETVSFAPVGLFVKTLAVYFPFTDVVQLLGHNKT